METTAMNHDLPVADRTVKDKPSGYVIPVRREKTAKRSVLIADAIADRTITIGGILVIIAVLGILVFLVAETFPLFQGGKVTARHEYTLEPDPGPGHGKRPPSPRG